MYSRGNTKQRIYSKCPHIVRRCLAYNPWECHKVWCIYIVGTLSETLGTVYIGWWVYIVYSHEHTKPRMYFIWSHIVRRCLSCICSEFQNIWCTSIVLTFSETLGTVYIRWWVYIVYSHGHTEPRVYTPNVHILFTDAWPVFLENFTKFGGLLLSGWSAKRMGPWTRIGYRLYRINQTVGIPCVLPWAYLASYILQRSTYCSRMSGL